MNAGKTYIGITSNGDARGNTIIGGFPFPNHTDNLTSNGKKLEVRGDGSFTGTVVGSNAVEDNEFVTKLQLDSKSTARPLTIIASIDIHKDVLNNQFPNAIIGDRYCNGRLTTNNEEAKVLVEYIGNGDWWVIVEALGSTSMGLAVDSQP